MLQFQPMNTRNWREDIGCLAFWMLCIVVPFCLLREYVNSGGALPHSHVLMSAALLAVAVVVKPRRDWMSDQPQNKRN